MHERLHGELYFLVFFKLKQTFEYHNMFSMAPYGNAVVSKLDFKKLDQETWLCRTHLDVFLVDFYIFGPFCLLGTDCFYPSLWDLSIWTRLFGPVSFDLSIWTYLTWPRYFDPYIWTLFLDQFIWTYLLTSVYLDPSICANLLGPVWLDPSSWTCLFGPVYMDPSRLTCLFGPV